MGDLEGWSFRPSSPCDALSGHPVLERPHRLVEGVPLDRLLPRPPDQPDDLIVRQPHGRPGTGFVVHALEHQDRKSTRLNSSHLVISYAVFCLKKKKNKTSHTTH